MEEKENLKEEKPFLSIRNLEKIYPNGEKAVYNFNLNIQRNEFIVIVGPSGCGKSTTLRMIAGLEDVSEGEIYLENELLNYKPSKDRKIAIVFQSYALYPQMNVFDNIAFPLKINKYPFPIVNEKLHSADSVERLFANSDANAVFSVISDKNYKRSKKTEHIANSLNLTLDAAEYLENLCEENSEETAEERRKRILSRCAETKQKEEERIKQSGLKYDDRFHEIDDEGKEKIVYRKMTPYEIRTKVYETADILDLGSYLDKLPKELSGGQMQRVALGRAIVKNVPLFLMDEPLSNLDAKLRLVMRSEIVKLHNKINATTIYVTHDQTEAMTMATRIVVMSRGFIQQIGTPEEVYENPKNLFVAKFIGSPSINIFEARYDNGTILRFSDDLTLKTQKGFGKIHDDFYEEKLKEFNEIYERFDKASAEKVLKILSAVSGEKKMSSGKKEKKSLLTRFRERFIKQEEQAEFCEEKSICEKMIHDIGATKKGEHRLIVGIRPEKIDIRLYRNEELKANQVVVQATLSELLGAEYHVHFDFNAQDIVCKFDKTQKIYAGDCFVFTLNWEDLMIFDPISGERIL